MSAADARRNLGILLQTKFPTWVVRDPQWSADDIRKPVLVLFRTTVAKFNKAPVWGMQDTFSLVLAVPQDTSEDALDGYLDDLLEALDESSETLWTEAQRDVYADTLPCYRITLTTISRRSS